MENNLQNTVANAMGMSVTEQGGNTPTDQPSTETQTKEVTGAATETQQGTDTTTEASNNSSTTTTENSNANSNTDVKNESSTIKSMREQLANQKAEYRKLEEKLNRITDYLGKSADDVLAEAQAKDDKSKAEALGVSPEVAKTIREQEQRIKELEQASIRDDFNNRATNFKREFKLNDKQLSDFFNDAIQKGFDLMRKGTDLGVIYRAINFEKLSAAKEAEIRQNILNEMQQQRETANGINTVSGTPAQVNTDSGTDQDFVNAIYKNFNK